MSGAIYGVTVVVGGTAANHISTITGMTIAVQSGSGKEIAAEVLGVVVPGVGGTLIKTAVKSPSGPTVGDLIDIAAAITRVIPGLQPLSVALTIGGIAWSVFEFKHRQFEQRVNQQFLDASTTRPQPIYRDPLAIDLDGDGIETAGIGSTPVTFDHNADGVRTGTGWVTGDDAWLVIDRNGNGSIDSGRELFGVDYLKANNQFATSGLDALRDLDSNADGVFNASDAAFAHMQLWRDVNQDGISQASELSSLADQSIASIGLSGTTANTNLGNGNTAAGTAVITRSDGSTTTASDLNAAHNPFFRSFANDIVVSDTAQALPQMGGAGWVRDLREAMSISEQRAQQQAQQPGYLQTLLGGIEQGRALAEQVQPMLNAYEQLRQSVYGALVMQTRLKPYLDAVEVVMEPFANVIPLNESEWRVIA